MNSMRFSVSSLEGATEERKEAETRAIRNKLLGLALDWEVAALTMDAERYKAHSILDRESLRDSAVVYRKCIAELTEIVAAVSPMRRKTAC